MADRTFNASCMGIDISFIFLTSQTSLMTFAYLHSDDSFQARRTTVSFMCTFELPCLGTLRSDTFKLMGPSYLSIVAV